MTTPAQQSLHEHMVEHRDLYRASMDRIVDKASATIVNPKLDQQARGDLARVLVLAQQYLDILEA